MSDPAATTEVVQNRFAFAAETEPQRGPSAPTSAAAAYAGDAAEELPIGGYATMMTVFVGAFTLLATGAKRAGVLPKRIPARDLALLGVAVHKLSRTLTRDRVAIPLRLPFTHYRGSAGAGEVREEPRGHGLRRAVGSLVTCQYCTGPWVALGLTAGLVFAPRVTRLASSLLAMDTVSDFLHQAYAGARRWSR